MLITMTAALLPIFITAVGMSVIVVLVMLFFRATDTYVPVPTADMIAFIFFLPWIAFVADAALVLGSWSYVLGVRFLS